MQKLLGLMNGVNIDVNCPVGAMHYCLLLLYKPGVVRLEKEGGDLLISCA